MKAAQHRSRRKHRSAAWIIACLAIAAAAVGVWRWMARPPVPPEVPLASIDRTLASLVETSRAAVNTSPKSAAAWGKLGQTLHAAEFTQPAMVCYSNAARLDPREARWPYLLGMLQMAHDPDAGLTNLTRAVALANGQTDAPRFTLARALVERGRFDEAIPQLGLLLAVNPDHAAARLELARIHAARGQFKEATQQLQAPLEHPLTRRPAMLLASQIAQRNGQPEVAAQLARSAQAMPRPADWPDPFLKEVLTLRVDRAQLADAANAFLQQQRFNDAEAALKRLLSAFPNDGEALLLLGRLRYLQRDCVAAEQAFRQHLQVQPGSLNGLTQLGMALMCQERWTNAAQVLEQVVALKPDFAAAHHNLGVCRSHSGDSAGAIRAFRDALRSTPGDVNALFSLAEELANVGQLKEARECIQRIEVLAPNDRRLPEARKQLGSGQ